MEIEGRNCERRHHPWQVQSEFDSGLKSCDFPKVASDNFLLPSTRLRIALHSALRGK
jgi:hypothetical protein